MKLTIANISTTINSNDFLRVISAIQKQVSNEFCQEWCISSTINGITMSLDGQASIQQDVEAVIYLGDSSQDPTTGVSGALGYHSSTYKQLPYGFVYLDICQKYDEVWTTTLSHEVLELLADPDVSSTVAGKSPTGDGTVYYDLEVCDPTQGDFYIIDDTKVSNFVTKSYFGKYSTNKSTNFMNLSLAPFGVRPSGYFQYEDSTGIHQKFGDKVSADKKLAKELMKNARRNKRRIEKYNSNKPRNIKGASMSNVDSTNQRSLRVELATNAELRRSMQIAAVNAAYQVLKNRGFVISQNDILEAKADFDALSGMGGPPIKGDTVQDVAAVISAVTPLAIFLGF